MEERKGYHFAGWYIDKECTKRINPGGILPHTMSLYDKWIPIWYPVVYQTDGGMIQERILIYHDRVRCYSIISGKKTREDF